MFGYGIEDKPLLSIAGGIVSVMGLLMDKVRESVVMEEERKTVTKSLEGFLDVKDDGIPF